MHSSEPEIKAPVKWEIEGGKPPVYRVSHKCSRFVIKPVKGGIRVTQITVRLISHRRVED